MERRAHQDDDPWILASKAGGWPAYAEVEPGQGTGSSGRRRLRRGRAELQGSGDGSSAVAQR
jgi:hypothetical protein